MMRRSPSNKKILNKRRRRKRKKMRLIMNLSKLMSLRKIFNRQRNLKMQ